MKYTTTAMLAVGLVLALAGAGQADPLIVTNKTTWIDPTPGLLLNLGNYETSSPYAKITPLGYPLPWGIQMKIDYKVAPTNAPIVSMDGRAGAPLRLREQDGARYNIRADGSAMYWEDEWGGGTMSATVTGTGIHDLAVLFHETTLYLFVDGVQTNTLSIASGVAVTPPGQIYLNPLYPDSYQVLQMRTFTWDGSPAGHTMPLLNIPEPATMSLLAIGGLAAMIRRRR